MSHSLPSILCVDDEPNVLAGLRRLLFDTFDVVPATSGKEALALLERQAFDAILSDMRMPEMSGATFLEHARKLAPDVTRLLLTGQTDAQSAQAAINRGGISAFLCKPCPPDQLITTLTGAVEATRRARVESDVLSQTVSGAIQMMVECLELTCPPALAMSRRVHSLIAYALEHENDPESWRLDAASQLCTLGLLATPEDALLRYVAGLSLPEEDQAIIDSSPSVAVTLIAKVPRLEALARIVGAQNDPDSLTDATERSHARLLHAATTIEQVVRRGKPLSSGLEILSDRGFSAEAKRFIGYRHPDSINDRFLTAGMLAEGMELASDLSDRNDRCLLVAGSVLSDLLIARIANLANSGRIEDRIHIAATQMSMAA